HGLFISFALSIRRSRSRRISKLSQPQIRSKLSYQSLFDFPFSFAYSGKRVHGMGAARFTPQSHTIGYTFALHATARTNSQDRNVTIPKAQGFFWFKCFHVFCFRCSFFSVSLTAC